MLTVFYRMCGTRRIEQGTVIGERDDDVLFDNGCWNPKSGTFFTPAQAAAKVCSCVSCGALRLEEETAGKLDKAEVRERVLQEIRDLSKNEPISELMLSAFSTLGWDYLSLEQLLELRDRIVEALELRLEYQVFSTMKQKEEVTG